LAVAAWSGPSSFVGSIAVGESILSSIDSFDLEQWIGKHDDDGYSPVTIAKATQLVRRALQEAENKDFIAKNQARALNDKLPTTEENEPRILTLGEAHHLADTINHRYRAFVLCAFHRGMRWVRPPQSVALESIYAAALQPSTRHSAVT